MKELSLWTWAGAAASADAATWKVTGTAVPALAGFDNQMKTFMQARGVTAGQLAVTYKWRLVLARGYSASTADVQPTSLFRIASLSKYMTGQKLDAAPGTKYAYSNFGYLLAGRVIEKLSGLSYEAYVQQKLLAPLQIKRMALGWSIAKHTGETSYESQYTGRTVLNNSGATVASP